MSSLGKGIVASGLAALLQAHGYKVRLKKFDPYLNVDPGTMNPNQHGEVFVTDDGAETDLDLGHYERFVHESASRYDTVTSGRVYSDVLAAERRGDYLGNTVQVIPHITDRIQELLPVDVKEDVDFLICEIGGTVGDIEGLPFIEAIRQFSQKVGSQNSLFIHLTYVPYLASAGEIKTKPSQHAVKELLHVGIQPQILMCRCEHPIPAEARRKLALFCNIDKDNVIEASDVDTIYAVPLKYHQSGLDRQVLKHFGLWKEQEADLSQWNDFVSRLRSPKAEVKIAVVGKYNEVKDSYKSILESFIHAGAANEAKVKVEILPAEDLEPQSFKTDQLKAFVKEKLSEYDGILVPGGYGLRGSQGKISAIEYARENQVPFFGICFGMQLAVIEYCRNVLGMKDATSSELEKKGNMVVGLLTEWEKDGKKAKRTGEEDMGGTMRLGAYPCQLIKGSGAAKIYGTSQISERHRHRYEVDVKIKPQLEKAGMVVSGLSPDGKLPEIVELPDHSWFYGMQFHPELKSRPFQPHPMFKSFIQAALEHKQKR